MTYYPARKGFPDITLQPGRTISLELPTITPGEISVDIFGISPASESDIHSADFDNPSIEKIEVKDISCDLLCDGASLGKGVDKISIDNQLTSNQFRLQITNEDGRIKLVYVLVKYVSNRRILTKKISLGFFRQAFNAMWNEVQPIEKLSFDGNEFKLIWKEQIRDVFPDFSAPLPDIIYPLEFPPHSGVRKDVKLNLKDLNTRRIEFLIETSKNPSAPKYSDKLDVAIVLNIYFEDEGAMEIEANGIGLIDLQNFSLQIKLYLIRIGSIISFKPFVTVNGSIDAGLLPDGYVDDKIDMAVKDGIEKAIGKQEYVQKYGTKITQWLLGGLYHVYNVSVKDDEMIIRYVEPHQEKEELTPLQPGPRIMTSPGSLKKIKHFVVLMMENRSFDQVLGYLSLENRSPKGNEKLPENSKVNGLKLAEFDKWSNPYNGTNYPPSLLKNPHVMQSPNHGYDSVREQKANNMKGFVADFANIPGNPDEPGVVMGYYNDSLLPVYAQLADEYLVCDRWYCSIPGGTWPNRFITVSGKLDTKQDGAADFTNPSMSTFYPVNTKTLFDHLTDQKISWKYFEHGYCFLRLFSKYTYDTDKIIDANNKENGFFASARNGTLPKVTFLDPDFIEYPPGNDDHAPSNPMAGQMLVGRVVNALKANKEAWEETMLIITYDEHGGFFDHVNPLVDEPAPTISGTLREYGLRVPTIIVSPWVKKGGYTNELFDHTSIAATILRRFCSPAPPDMGPRANAANDLRNVIENTVRKDIPDVDLPKFEGTPEVRQKLPTPSKKINSNNTEDDFHELLLFSSMFGRLPKSK